MGKKQCQHVLYLLGPQKSARRKVSQHAPISVVSGPHLMHCTPEAEAEQH